MGCHTAGEGATHHAGCECWEARAAKDRADLDTARELLRELLVTGGIDERIPGSHYHAFRHYEAKGRAAAFLERKP